MSRITMELLRKRSEHNEGEIHNLEEVSLHQQNIEKIELLNEACRHLRILLLQNNVISKIENLNKLKRLEYLNLAINNIEVIENLEGLESLRKLDLTANFIGDLKGVQKLRFNENLEELFLTGNPCAEYEGYRAYVIAALPQLKELDMVEIDRTESIKALQMCARANDDVIRGFKNYLKLRGKQIEEYERNTNEDYEENDGTNEESENDRFWKKKSLNTPETRREIAERRLKIERDKNNVPKEKVEKKVIKFFNPDGKPYNMNQGKVGFKFIEDDPQNLILEVEVYKYLDTSYVDVDIQTFYVRVTIKGKVLQLTLPCEIQTERSFAKRNVVTGRLEITMPRFNPRDALRGKSSVERNRKEGQNINGANKTNKKDNGSKKMTQYARDRVSKRELLEIGPPKRDFLMIVEEKQVNEKRTETKEKEEDSEFEDNPDVPPLE